MDHLWNERRDRCEISQPYLHKYCQTMIYTVRQEFERRVTNELALPSVVLSKR